MFIELNSVTIATTEIILITIIQEFFKRARRVNGAQVDGDGRFSFAQREPAAERVLAVVRVLAAVRVIAEVRVLAAVRVRRVRPVTVRVRRVVVGLRAGGVRDDDGLRGGGRGVGHPDDDGGRGGGRRDDDGLLGGRGGDAGHRFADHLGGETVDGVRPVPDGAQIAVRVDGTVVAGHVVAVARLLLVLLVAGRRVVDGVPELVLRRRRRWSVEGGRRGARQRHAAQQSDGLRQRNHVAGR